MIAEHFGVACSSQCELVLALGTLINKANLVPLAHRLANDRDRSAVRLAQAISEMPAEDAELLSRLTLQRSGIWIEQSKQDSRRLDDIMQLSFEK